MNTKTHTVISYLDIHQALERCMKVEPVEGKEYGLSRDASLLGDILGEMIWRKLNEIPVTVMDRKHLEALNRWMATDKQTVEVSK